MILKRRGRVARLKYFVSNDVCFYFDSFLKRNAEAVPKNEEDVEDDEGSVNILISFVCQTGSREVQAQAVI